MTTELSYDTFSLDPTPDVPICPLVDNGFFNYFNVSVMHNITAVWISGDIDALHQLSLVRLEKTLLQM